MDSANKKLWGGRFGKKSSSVTERMSSSIQFDCRLYRQDIRGSLAHASMLKKIGILDEDEFKKIETGLREIESEIEKGEFPFSSELEDIHMNIEARLTERIGDAGKKLHTGRSRNDQIATDVRMYILDEGSAIKGLLAELIAVMTGMAGDNTDIVMPGYTHLQAAQPVRFSHHLLAYGWKFLRDMGRLEASLKAASVLPLGAGALAGVNYNNDREFLREKLGFDSVSPNSMDAVSDRDFVLDFLYFSSVLAMHLSRLSEELIIWSSAEFSFITLGDSVTTGSSIMPQKRNPDLAELIRGKTGRVYGNLLSLLTILKGLPMTYNRDMQEDKEPLFDTIDTIRLSLEGMTEMFRNMKINGDRMKEGVYRNYITATDLADYLVKKGVPFRSCHEIAGSIVKYCEDSGRDFFSLKLEDLKKFSPVFGEDAVEALKPESSAERKESAGGTSLREVEKQLQEIRKVLNSMTGTVDASR